MAIVNSSLLVITLKVVELNSPMKRLNAVSEWLKNEAQLHALYYKGS